LGNVGFGGDNVEAVQVTSKLMRYARTGEEKVPKFLPPKELTRLDPDGKTRRLWKRPIVREDGTTFEDYKNEHEEYKSNARVNLVDAYKRHMYKDDGKKEFIK